MNSIKTQVSDIAKNILALSEKTQQIGDIITTVNDISAQSNMLARAVHLAPTTPLKSREPKLVGQKRFTALKNIATIPTGF